jgi:Uma2 family endonuclease
MSQVLKVLNLDRPGWIPAKITDHWDSNPYAYQTEEELMPAGGLHGQLLAYLMEVLRATLKERGLMLLLDTFLLYRDPQGIKQRIAPDLLLMPYRFPPPSAYDLDIEPPPLSVVEVTSPKSHLQDLHHKVPFYFSLGISTYLVIDAVTPRSQLRKQIELHLWQRLDGQPSKIETAGECMIPEMGLTISAQGQQLYFTESATGKVLLNGEQWHQALQMAKQRAEMEIQRADIATQRAEVATQRADCEAQRANRAEQRAMTAEAEIARLKALLAEQD